MAARRVTLTEEPFLNYDPQRHWEGIGEWPAQWVGCAQAGPTPFAAAFRCLFSLPTARAVRVHVSADERYELFLDGQRVGRGSERGSPQHWHFETYDLDLTAGEHSLAARVWALGEAAPYAQMSARPGWLVAADDLTLAPLLTTGAAPWETKRLDGYRFYPPQTSHFFVAGDCCELDAAQFGWGFERGEGEGWQPVVTLEPAVSAARYRLSQAAHELVPTSLPPMMEAARQIGVARLVEEADSPDTARRAVDLARHLAGEAEDWNALLQGQGTIQVEPNNARRVIIDLEDYYCAYPQLTVEGGKGALVRLNWAEGLYCEPQGRTKGNRDEIEGKYFNGIGDSFLPDGGAQPRQWELLWWRAGRYLELFVQTAEEGLTLLGFTLRETRYPLEMESQFAASDRRLEALTPIAARALQMCAHETYMDCPYYEQLMYVGDTRLEVLVTYAITRDERLPRKALRTFDVSRILSGLTQSRYPSRIMQIIPPFSLWWVAMVHDYALWRGEPDFVRSLLPGVRSVIEAFLGFRNGDGLVQSPQGWNFMDWAPDWKAWGVPPDGSEGVSGLINWQFVWALNLAADLEEWFGEPELAARDRRQAGELAERVQSRFWDEGRQLFADDLAHAHFSEHSQCLAVLSGALPPAQQERVLGSLLNSDDLTRTTIYFMHYLFEAYRLAGAGEAFFERLGLWFGHPGLGMKTTLEQPEPSRSDCHAWGAHPLFHDFATLLGICPAQPGFGKVRIAPLLGPLNEASGILVHPKGTIAVKLAREDQKLRASVELPEGVTGVFTWNGQTVDLKPGPQSFTI